MVHSHTETWNAFRVGSGLTEEEVEGGGSKECDRYGIVGAGVGAGTGV